MHGDKVNDEYWLAGYLGYNNTKYLLRNLGLSPVVLQWAFEQNLFKFTPKETGAALTLLSESEEFGDGDTPLGLMSFNDIEEFTQTYISPYLGDDGQAQPKSIPNETRVDALARILITVGEELDVLADPHLDLEDGGAFYAQRKGPTAEHIRSLNSMPYFGLPDIPIDRLRIPELGPLEFNGRKEHVCEKWTRILTLLRYASTRVSKSKYNMAGCIGTGSSLGDSDKQRTALSPEARRQLIEQGGRKWLGLDEDWNDPFLELPVWMRPVNMDVDKTREIKEKDPSNARRPLIFEAVWLEDLPGDNPDLGPRCKEFWADKGLREEFGIPEHIKAPDFASSINRPIVRDPREFPGYPQWRDSLRAQLFFIDWKLDLYQAFLINRKITKGAISPDLFASGLEASATDGEPRCVCILDPSGEDPPMAYHQLLKLVEEGEGTQTIAFLCQPLSGSEIRHYPWETN